MLNRLSWNIGFDVLVPEAGYALRAHIAADHAVGQARLKGLIDDAAAPAEVTFATAHEAVERQLFGHTAALRMQYTYKSVSGDCLTDRLHLPYALPAIAAGEDVDFRISILIANPAEL